MAAISFNDKSTPALSLNTRATRARTDAVLEAIEADEKMRALRAQMFGTDLLKQAHEYASALGGVANVSKLLPEQMATMNTTFKNAADHLERLNQTGRPPMQCSKNSSPRPCPFPTFSRMRGTSLDALLSTLPKVGGIPDIFGKVNISLANLLNTLPKVSAEVLKLPEALAAVPLQSATEGWMRSRWR